MLKLLRLTLSSVVLISHCQLAAAQDWQWHGFISQGLMQSADSNFVNDDGALSTELTELGLNGSYQFTPTLRVAGQVMSLDGGNRYADGARIDYLFLHWTIMNTMDWQVQVYAGRFKNMHWLYSSTRDVPMTRPMIVLPQSVYFDAFRDIAVGSDGLALQSLSQISAGEIEFNWSYGATPISLDNARGVVGRDIFGKTTQDFVHQMSWYFRPLHSQMQWGLSLLDSDFHYNRAPVDYFVDGDFTVQRFMLNWRYSAEQWELSSEFMQERVLANDFYAKGFHRDQFAQGIYVLGSYNLTSQSRVYAGYDWYTANKDDRRGAQLPLQTGGQIPAYFGYQYDKSLGFSHDIRPDLRVVMEYHWNTGTGRLGPNVVPDVKINKHRNHNLWALQLMYWF